MLWHPQPYDCNCCSSIALPLITTTKKISLCSLSKTEASSQPVAHLSSNLTRNDFPKSGGSEFSSREALPPKVIHLTIMTACVNTLLSGRSRLWCCRCAPEDFFFCDYHQCSRDECRERRGDSDKTSDHLCQDLDCVESVIIKGRWFFFLLFF